MVRQPRRDPSEILKGRVQLIDGIDHYDQWLFLCGLPEKVCQNLPDLLRRIRHLLKSERLP